MGPRSRLAVNHYAREAEHRWRAHFDESLTHLFRDEKKMRLIGGGVTRTSGTPQGAV
jgi:hypothetical protein